MTRIIAILLAVGVMLTASTTVAAQDTGGYWVDTDDYCAWLIPKRDLKAEVAAEKAAWLEALDVYNTIFEREALTFGHDPLPGYVRALMPFEHVLNFVTKKQHTRSVRALKRSIRGWNSDADHFRMQCERAIEAVEYSGYGESAPLPVPDYLSPLFVEEE